MSIRAGIVFAFLSLPFASAIGQTITLTVPSGAPLRVYLTKKVSKRLGAPVAAKLLEPLFAFDHEVVPAGTEVTGRVSRLESLTKWQRFRTILAGDFTPLHQAEIEFTSLSLPGGRRVPLHTAATVGLNSIYSPPRPKKGKPNPQPANGGVLGTADQSVRGQIHERIRSAADLVRAPNKKERLADFLLSKLPYHPQWVRRGTRFDAELTGPLAFGSEPVVKTAFDLLGSQPPPDAVAIARLVASLDSGSAAKGQTVEALLVAPVFSPDRKLVLPEGTRLVGTVITVRKARWFHRGGRLRFNFERLDLPEEAVGLRAAGREHAAVRAEATLDAAESSGATATKVDSEGGVHATEPKSRFIAPVVSWMIANRAMDNDVNRLTGRTDANVSGKSLGGASGLGLLGVAAAQGSRYAGAALGFYGLAWSVYSNVISRGSEVHFEKNAAIEIRFGTRTPSRASKLLAATRR